MSWVVCNACDWGQHELCYRHWTPHPTRGPLAPADTAPGMDRYAGCWVLCECYSYNANDHPATADDNPWIKRLQDRNG